MACAATFTRSTSTKLSKNVAPPPRSVRRVGVVELQLRSPKLCLFHQMLGVTTTPGRTLSPTRARAMKDPRSLKTLTNSSCRMPRAVASATLISNCGSTADRRNESTSTNVEFKKCGDGGDKHVLLAADRLAQVQKLADAGVGLVHLHQVIDYPKEL